MSLDAFFRQTMRAWPQTPPGLENADFGAAGAWLKARPCSETDPESPLLKVPGSARMRTVPDGLWLWFGGDANDPYVDLFAVEVCGGLQNLLDKRSRYAPSLHSLLITCPLAWLLSPVPGNEAVPRWQATGLLDQAPSRALVLPVRDIRVLYALKPRQFQEFACGSLAHAHELFAPIDALTGIGAWRAPAMRDFLGRAARRANFWDSAIVPQGRDESRGRHIASFAPQAGNHPVRIVGNQRINTESDHGFNVVREIDGPRYDREAERLRQFARTPVKRAVQRRPGASAGGGHGPGQLAAERR